MIQGSLYSWSTKALSSSTVSLVRLQLPSDRWRLLKTHRKIEIGFSSVQLSSVFKWEKIKVCTCCRGCEELCHPLCTYLCLCLRLSSSWATEEHVSASFTISLRRWNKAFSGYFLSSASSSNTLSSMRSKGDKKNPKNDKTWHNIKRQFTLATCKYCASNLSCFSGQQPRPQ